jgi:branched-chain amino acid transport system substrate-binding protein
MMSRAGLHSLLIFMAAALCAAPALAQGVTDTEIVLGVSSSFKGNNASLGTELYRGYMACFARVNAGGGVNGRRIRVIAYDDGYDPARTFANTVQLVEKDGVFLLLGNVGTPTTVKVLPLLTRYKAIPLYLFGPFTGAQDFRDNPLILNVRASYRQETAALVDLFAGMGKKKVAVFYQNDSYGRSGYDGVQRALKARGLAIAAEANYERGTAFEQGMEAQVKVIRGAGADAVICVGTYQPCAAFIRDLRKSGFDGPVANISFVGSESLLSLLLTQEKKDGRPYAANLFNSLVVPSYDDLAFPLVAKYQEDTRKYGPAIPPGLQDPKYQPLPLSSGGLEGYVDAVVLVKGLEKAGRNLTPAGFMSAIEGMTSLDIGLAVPVSFSPEKHQGRDKVYLVKAAGGAWSPVR